MLEIFIVEPGLNKEIEPVFQQVVSVNLEKLGKKWASTKEHEQKKETTYEQIQLKVRG